MQTALRPYVTAGVALVGSSVITVTPAAPPLPELQSPPVQLTSTGESIFDAWITQFNDASANATGLVNNFGLGPGVAMQQVFANHLGYLDEVIADPSKISDVLHSIATNTHTVLSSLALAGASDATVKVVEDHTLNGLHSAIASLLPDFLPDADKPAAETIIQLLSSPLSAMFLASVGPIISPGVGLLNGLETLAADPSLANLLAVPADVVGGVFNGATLDLDALIPLIDKLDILPTGVEIDGLSYAFPGLLSAGSVSQIYDFYPYDSKDTFLTVPAVGGSMLNSLGLDIDFDGFKLDIPGVPAGPIAAWESLSQTIGVLLGSGWDAKGQLVPPLAHLTFPTIPVDDGGASAAATSILPSDILPADALPVLGADLNGLLGLL